jgi:tetratricopeptide (TPR) repeat protein
LNALKAFVAIIREIKMISFKTNAENPYEKKCKEYSEAINHDPQNVNLYVERSKAYRELKKYNLAIQDIDTAIGLDPQRKYCFYFLRHLIFWDSGNLEKSLKDIKQAVKLAPRGYIYHKYLAKVYVKLGQIDDAVLALKQEIEEYPENRQAYLDSAEFFEGIGRFKDALENINKAIDIEPSRLDSYHKRARIFIKMEQFDDALRDCNTCIKLEPRECSHFSVRSEVYKAMGDTRSAQADYDMSIIFL